MHTHTHTHTHIHTHIYLYIVYVCVFMCVCVLYTLHYRLFTELQKKENTNKYHLLMRKINLQKLIFVNTSLKLAITKFYLVLKLIQNLIFDVQ